MGLPIAMLALWPWGWQQNPMDQSEIIPRIYQIGSKEKAAEPLEARKCVLGTPGSPGFQPSGESPFERLKLLWWKTQRPVKRDNEWVFKSDQLHSTLPILVLWSKIFIFLPRPVQVEFLAPGEINITKRQKCCYIWERTRTWHLSLCQDLSLHHHPGDSLGHSPHLVLISILDRQSLVTENSHALHSRLLLPVFFFFR